MLQTRPPGWQDRRRDDDERPLRILFYSHDSFGLGHLRRNLTLARAMADAFPRASILIATGSPCATSFPVPRGVDVVKIPSVTKEESGAYVSRALPEDLSSLLHLRRRLLFETYRTFSPELIVVDHQVVGMHSEMRDVLEHAREHDVRTVLGVRDVIDSPERVAIEWGTEDVRWALENAYDRVCVYGAPEVFDPRTEYPIPPELRTRLEFVGYVAPPAPAPVRRPLPSLRPRVLVTVGGGEDGAERIDAYMDMLALARPRWRSTVLTGPLLEPRKARRLRRRAVELGDVTVHRFHADVPRLLAESEAVVSMAGYNSCAEILRSRRPAVFLPRLAPRQEQRIRATRLAALGLGVALTRRDPFALRNAVEEALEKPRLRGPVPSLEGARRLAEIAGELLSPDRARSLVS